MIKPIYDEYELERIKTHCNGCDVGKNLHALRTFYESYLSSGIEMDYSAVRFLCCYLKFVQTKYEDGG